MTYSKELKEMVYPEYADFSKCIEALESGNRILGRYLCDSIPNGIERCEHLKGVELEINILEQVRKMWRREDIYWAWRQEVTD